MLYNIYMLYNMVLYNMCYIKVKQHEHVIYRKVLYNMLHNTLLYNML
jgi:hypothetical protein